MDTFTLSRNFWNFCFDNPEKINPGHGAIFFFAVEHCNRLGWKEKFGFPSQMVMEAVGIRNWRTYQKYLTDLVDWGFIEMIEKSKNQYSSNIIAIVKNTKAPTKALDKALSKHNTKHSQSTDSIDIQDNKKQYNKSPEDLKKEYQEFIEGNRNVTTIILKVFFDLGYKPKEPLDKFRERVQDRVINYHNIETLDSFEFKLKSFYDFWIDEPNSKKKNKNWKSTLTNSFHLKDIRK